MIRKTRVHFFVYLISSLAALTGLLFGYDTGVISGAILFIRKDFQLTATLTEVTVAAVLLGAVLGSAISGRVTDILGRKNILILVACIFIIGTLVSAFSPNTPWLIVGRIILGVAIGVGSYVAPLYLAEIAPKQIRGMLVSLNQLLITIGIVLSYIVDYFFARTGAWRWMLALGVIPAIILLIGVLFLPESPRWMVLHGRYTRAKEILSGLRETDAEVNSELTEIQQSISKGRGSFKTLFAKWLRPAIAVAFGLSFFQQVTGINTIIYYAPTILEIAGFKEATGAILATLGVGIINVLFTILALRLIDRLGRRPLLITGLILMFVSLCTLSVAFYVQKRVPIMAVGSMVLYIAGFAISLGPIMWLIISEVFPLEIRGLAVSVAVALSWVVNLLVALTFLTLIQALGPSGTFGLYAALTVLALLFVYFVVPETKGVSLEEIERNLLSGKPSRELGQPV